MILLPKRDKVIWDKVVNTLPISVADQPHAEASIASSDDDGDSQDVNAAQKNKTAAVEQTPPTATEQHAARQYAHYIDDRIYWASASHMCHIAAYLHA